MNLQDIRIIDLKKSAFDAKLSKPDEGEYVFLDKKYIQGNHSENSFFSWCRYEPRNGYRELNEWRIKFGYLPVRVADKDFVPDGVPKNAEGHFVYGDLILVKCPLIEELKRRAEAEDMSKGAAKAKIRGFGEQMKREDASIPQGMIDEMLGL